MNFFRKSFYAAIIAAFLLISTSVGAFAQNALTKTTQLIALGETNINVNIYEKKGVPITFVAPHHNEKISIKVAKELIEKYGGRLIEIEAVDENGNAARRLQFKFANKSYSVDPNRVFTEYGRQCNNPPEIVPHIKTFSDNFLKLALQDGVRLREGEQFLVALHNNGDIDEPGRTDEQKERDLSAFSFIRGGRPQHPLLGAHQAQAEGVFISNVEYDEDNFLFVTSPAHLGFFAEKGFNVILQKPAARLQVKACQVDDGSLSVFSAFYNIPYINVEGDARFGEFRQRQMIEAVYELLKAKWGFINKAI